MSSVLLLTSNDATPLKREGDKLDAIGLVTISTFSRVRGEAGFGREVRERFPLRFRMKGLVNVEELTGNP